MRIAVLADTHTPRGARRLPASCVHELRRADLILHAGDFTAASVLEELRGFAAVEAVHGNMDTAELRALLPERRVVEAEGCRIGMVHEPGPRAGREARLAAWLPGCDLVVYGHTHQPSSGRSRVSASSTRAARPSAAGRPCTRWERSSSRTVALTRTSVRCSMTNTCSLAC